MAKEKKGKDAKNKEVDKKNLLKHVDSIAVGNGTVEVFGFKPMGSLDTVLLGVTVNKAGDPTSVNFLEAHNVKLKSKKGNPSLVFENAAKAEAKAEKRAEKKEKKGKGEDKADKKADKKAGKKTKKED